MKINTIIFDLGGVIIDLDEQATAKSFSGLSSIPLDRVQELFSNEYLFKSYEMGLVSSNVFRRDVSKLLDIRIDDQTFDQAWNAMLGEITLARIEFLQELRQRFKIFILSNTNEIHEKAFNQILKNASSRKDLFECADQVFFSHYMKKRKPNQDIYIDLIESSGIQAKESIFLDDKPENLAGAASVGIQTMHIKSPNDIFKLSSYV